MGVFCLHQKLSVSISAYEVIHYFEPNYDLVSLLNTDPYYCLYLNIK